MADNTSHFYLLRQKSDSIEAIKDAKRLPVGEWGYNLLKTVHTAPGKYAEIMCVTPYGVGVGRLVLNNFQKVLFSTKAEDVVALRKLREQGMDLHQAVQHLVKQRFGDASEYDIAMPAPGASRKEEKAA